MSKLIIRDALLNALDKDKIITGNQIEEIQNSLNIDNFQEIIEEILDQDFTFIPLPLPNEYNTSIIYQLN